MYERNKSFKKLKEIQMKHLRQQDFAKNTKVMKQVTVTYLVQERHEAIVAIDESLDDDEIYKAVRGQIHSINWDCPDNEQTDEDVDEDSIEIDEFSDPDNIKLNNRYYLLKKVDGKYVGGIALSSEV